MSSSVDDQSDSRDEFTRPEDSMAGPADNPHSPDASAECLAQNGPSPSQSTAIWISPNTPPPASDGGIVNFSELINQSAAEYGCASHHSSEQNGREHAAAQDESGSTKLTQLGRYRVQRVLGQGGFGIVYLAFDPQLQRQVALKVPRRERFATKAELDGFLVEARTAAKLKHPFLVAVYDVQMAGDVPFIVQEYVESRNLTEWCAQVRPSFEQIARIIVGISEAVGFIHSQGLIHCDLKAANILMDNAGHPHVADFGLATHENVQHLLRGYRFGTPAAMSPEQVRGESHLMDGRTDIWAMGVMLYQMLTGRVPFAAAQRDELFELIRTHDPRPPRQYERNVPRELERICLKCLSQRRADRYNTADDLRDDILNWLGQDPSTLVAPPVDTVPSKAPSFKSDVLPNIVPKGLRTYDAEDADFFLALLPGPRDRDGIPESIRFWRHRVEQRDPEQTFRVGLLYGPSGCGKSSLVKAGLIPRLSDNVLPIYVEASPDDTEARILLKLRSRIPTLPADVSLSEVCKFIRLNQESGRSKVLLIIDQFEQWLHAHPFSKTSQLLDALRQCDGGRLQAILMVRDDFFLSVSRVFQELEIRLVEGSNCGMVDYFDLDHSYKILAALGHAYGKLGDWPSPSDEKFLKQAIHEIAENGKVICVQLALFADMMKSRPWVPASLQLLGGVKGVGVAMLDETFNPQTAPLSYRIHEEAIRRVLRSLLPKAGTDIKGVMQSADDLQKIAGYVDRHQAFIELIEILDGERRLITPIDSAGLNTTDTADPSSRYYQLTHDYLVPSLRTWLTRKQHEHMRGRAEIRLAEVADEWKAKPDHKRLPTTWEYLTIRLLTRPALWTAQERKVMGAAARFHGQRWLMTFTIIALSGAFLWNLVAAHRQQIAAERHESQRKQAELLVTTALNAPAVAVPYAAQNVQPLRGLALPILQHRFEDPSLNPVERLRTAILLSHFGEHRTAFLIDCIDTAEKSECRNILAALQSCGRPAITALNQQIQQAEKQKNWRLKARLALTLLELGHPSSAQQMLRLVGDPAERVHLIDAIPQWHGSLTGLLQQVTAAQTPHLRSGIILGVGSVPRNEVPVSDLEAATRILSRWYQELPDSGTHGAAGWVLRNWQRPLPQVDHAINATRDWHLNTVEITMVKIPPVDRLPATSQSDLLNWPTASRPQFWISDREVSRGTFQIFVDDPGCPDTDKPAAWEGPDTERSPSLDHPIQRVSWSDAVMFCNWLSRRENRQESYVRNGETWQLVPGTKGYRLPTEAEWEYGCRAGTTTEFVCGNDEQFLPRYAVYRSNQTGICGSRLPNPWGLFDVHGNVYEWCQDSFVSDMNQRYILCSGAFDYSATKCRSSNRESNIISYRSRTIGFRIARDLD